MGAVRVTGSDGSGAATADIAVIALATVASGVIAWRFIFPVPAVFSGVLANAYVAAR